MHNLVDRMICFVNPHASSSLHFAHKHLKHAYEAQVRATTGTHGASVNVDHKVDARTLRAKECVLVQNVAHIWAGINGLVAPTVGE